MIPSKDVKIKILEVKGHNYRIFAVRKSRLMKGDPAKSRIKGRWLVAVERDGAKLPGSDYAKLKKFYSTAALYAAYPNLKGKLGGLLQ